MLNSKTEPMSKHTTDIVTLRNYRPGGEPGPLHKALRQAALDYAPDPALAQETIVGTPPVQGSANENTVVMAPALTAPAQSVPAPRAPAPSTLARSAPAQSVPAQGARQRPPALHQPAQGKQRAIDVKLPPEKVFWRSIGAGPALMHYNWLIVLSLAANAVYLALGIANGVFWTGSGFALTAISDLVLLNLAVAIGIRQQYVVNLLFWLATLAPTSWPLFIRRRLAKVYHFGGLHVGGAIAGTLWFTFLFAASTYHLANGLPGVSVGNLLVTYSLMAVLLVIVFMSLPPMRARFHNQFELTHRFGGWSALALFWAQTIMNINDARGAASLGTALVDASSFWLLVALTVSIALPWLRLRKVPVEIETPSSHVALAHFDYGVTPFAGSSTTISRSPLTEWHAFANVPSPDREGFRLTISRAGDWTGSFIDDKPSHVWVKGIPTAGVANIEKLFKKVVYVATGSGIGPCLPHLLAGDVPARLVWSTRSPRKTYGDQLVDEILQVQPDAIIWDTDADGKPDMVKLAYQAYREFGAEAVICISNKKLTWQVVYGMESRGIPAYGAIWDS